MARTRSARSTLGLTLAAALCVFSATAARAVDMTGTWNVYTESFPSEVIDFAQTGTVLTGRVNGEPFPSYNGSIVGNDFSVQTIIPFVGMAQRQGTVRADGNGFSGVFSGCEFVCQGRDCHCGTVQTFAMRGCRVGASGDCCGDGVVGPSEQCDPGPIDACCDAFCQVPPPGTLCTGDGNVCNVNACDASGSCVVQGPASSGTSCPGGVDANPCTDAGVCDGAGACTLPPSPAGTPCADDLDICTLDVCDGAGSCGHPPGPDADADGTCDERDPCTNGVALERPRLVMRGDLSTAIADKVRIRGQAQFPASLVIDPPSSGMNVIVNSPTWNGIHLTLFATLPIPNDLPGWTVGRNGRYRYRSPGGPEVWDAKVTVSPRTPGLVKIDLRGSGVQLPAPFTGTPVYMRVAMGMIEVSTERCAEVTFTGPRPDPVCTHFTTQLSCH